MRLQLEAYATTTEAGVLERKTPRAEFLLFPFGTVPTAYGELYFDPEAGQSVLKCYSEMTANREGWLDIDIAHLSQTDIPEMSAHLSAGRFKIALRPDGLWVTNVEYTPEAYEAVATQKLKYYSPVINYDGKRRIVELLQLGLTNIPAMKNAQPLALSQRGGKTMEFNPLALLSLAGQHNVNKLSLEMPELQGLVNALMDALYARFPFSVHLEEVYPEYAVVGVYEASAPGALHPEHYYKVPYAVVDGVVQLQSPVEVRKIWQEASEPEMLSAMNALRSRIKDLESSGSEMLSRKEHEHTVLALQSRIKDLEAKTFDAEVQISLSAAKQSGRWTAPLEKLALRNAERARRMGEDPIEAYREIWEAAPVVVAQVQLQTAPVVPNAQRMHPEDEQKFRAVARSAGRNEDEFLAHVMAMRSKMAR